MLILPIQHRVNWSRPPILCLLLILANIFVYCIFSTHDDESATRMLAQYQQATLLPQEWPLYNTYRANTGHPITAEEDIAPDAEKILTILLDTHFDSYLTDHWQKQAGDENLQWQTARHEIEALRDQQSALRYGIKPAEKKPITFLTYMFMHGGVEHLLGNMIFLFLFGFTMETVMGKWRFLAIYLASGIGSAAFFCLFNAGSYLPLVGASGAIAGLMGMYIAAYHIQRIRFFYFLFFWFGEFTAPALVVLPLWIGKELWEQRFGDSHVAYLGHVGGMLSGYLLTALALRLQKNEEDHCYTVPEIDDSASTFVRKMARVTQYVNRLDIDNAKQLCRILQQDYPERFEPWERLYDIVRPHRQSEEFHQTAREIFSKANQPWMPTDLLGKVLDDYRQADKTLQALDGANCALLAQRFIRENRLQDADFLLRRAIGTGYRQAAITPLIESILVQHQRAGNNNAARFYQDQLRQLPGRQ